MSVRIVREVESGTTVLGIAGWLSGEHSRDLEREYGKAVGPVVLELSQLRSSDQSGVTKLLDLASRGAEIRGASGYVDLLLKRATRGRCSCSGDRADRSDLCVAHTTIDNVLAASDKRGVI